MNQRLRVLFVSDRSLENPYRKLLEEAVRKLGIDTHFVASGGRLPFLGLALWRFRPQVLHLQWASNFLLGRTVGRSVIKSVVFMAQLLLARWSGLSIIWTVHNLGQHEQRLARTERLLRICLARLCHVLVVHHPRAEQVVRAAYRLPPSKEILVIEHPSYAGYYPDCISRDQARRSLGFHHDEVVLLCFGLMRPYKRITEVVRAFKGLTAPKARLLLAGRVPDDQLQKELEGELAGDCRIQARFEFIPKGEVQIYLRAADAVVVAAEEALTSGSAVLAMSFGRALLAVDAPHLRHLLGSRGGLLFPRSTEKDIRWAMERALEADLEGMGKHNLERISWVTWDDAAGRLRDLYERARSR